MKGIISGLFCLLLGFNTNAQIYFTKDGNITFHSETPIEKIEASNDKGVSIIDFPAGKMEFSVLIKAFYFKNALMQTHFNENYMESNKYPKAVFKGSCEALAQIDLMKDGEHAIPVKGILRIRETEKEVNTTVNLQIAEGLIRGWTQLILHPSDFDISIPAIVRDKIAKDITVDVTADYILYEKS